MNEKVYIVIAILSIIIFSIGIVTLCVSLRKSNSLKKSLILYFLPLLVAALFMMRYIYVDYVNEFSQGLLGAWEEFMDVLFYTIFAFSIESENVMIADCLRELVNDTVQFGFLADIIKAYVSLLNIIAPIAGCAIILDLICGLFPKIRIGLEWKREKYIFSELNEKTICMATDIRNTLGKNATVIFTKVLQQENEVEVQLHKKAKAIDAICLKESITQTKLPGNKNVYYILLNDKLVDNIDLMTELIGGYKSLCSRASEKSIVLFAQDDYVDDIVDRIHMSEELKKDNVSIRVIREYTNLVYDILLEDPLYKHINEEKGTLDLLITGCGVIGREMLLAAYWCGQFGNLGLGRKKIRLGIHVVDVNANKIKSKLQAEFPEISFNGEENNYCDFHFYDCDITQCEFRKMFSAGEVFSEVDYIVVSLGNDLMNFKTAQMINRQLERTHATEYTHSINYIVEDDSIKMHMTNYFDEGNVKSFGNISGRYSIRNVFSSRIYKMAQEVNDAYFEGYDLDELHKNFAHDSYNIKASAATAVHAWYKLYSVNALDKSSETACMLVDQNLDYLAWLEHQRWNAYMRSIGYVQASHAVIENLNKTKDRKKRMHGCLVESNEGINITAEDWGKENIEKYDELDNFSLWFYNRTKEKVDYKIFDYDQVKLVRKIVIDSYNKKEVE